MFCCRAVLLKLFMAGSKAGEADKMEHIAAILTNVTRLKPGRALLLQPGRGFIEALVAQLKSTNLLRRQGCAAAFRNCCFSAEVSKILPAHGLAAAMLGDSAVSPTSSSPKPALVAGMGFCFQCEDNHGFRLLDAAQSAT